MQNEFLLTMKSFAMLILAGLLSIITDYQYAFVALIVGFTLNFLMGMGADVNDADKENFCMKKATNGFKLLMFYVITIFCIVGMTYRDPEVSEQIIRFLTYIVSYFYLTNTFRNAKIIFPGNKSIEFIYSFLSTEAFYRLKDYLGFRNKKQKE